MERSGVETARATPTSPEAAEELVDLAETSEKFTEPTGTVAEARREGAEIPEAELDDAATRQQTLEEARERMWSTPPSEGADEIGVQEEETARIADSLVFPGTGVREIREREHVDDTLTEVQRPGVPPTSETPDRFPPSEWPDDRKQ